MKSRILKKSHGLIVALVTIVSPAAADEQPLTVYAAASLTTLLNDITPAFEQATSADVSLVFAGTGALARQIEAGAPADVYLSANERWMSYLESRAAIDPETQIIFARNRIALIASVTSTWTVDLETRTLPSIVAKSPFAIADPDSVPAGMYGTQALRALGLLDDLNRAFVYAADVRVALKWVARGDTGAGLVYVTDALTEPDVRIVALFPEDSHDPINYWAAQVATSLNDLSKPFLDFLTQSEARATLVSQGFALPGSESLDPPPQSP